MQAERVGLRTIALLSTKNLQIAKDIYKIPLKARLMGQRWYTFLPYVCVPPKHEPAGHILMMQTNKSITPQPPVRGCC